jgi:hypothetical protein
MATINEITPAPTPDAQAVAVVQDGVLDVTDEEGNVTGQEPVLVHVHFWPELVNQWPAANLREFIFAEAGVVSRREMLANLKAWHDAEDVAASKIPDQAKQALHKSHSERIQSEMDAIDAANPDTSALLG